MTPPIIVHSKKDLPRRVVVKDIVPVLLEELFIVRNPRFKREPFKRLPEWRRFLDETEGREIFVCWPWSKTAVRILDEKLYFEIRTARNRNLITKAEQSAYRELTVGVGGLSVGSSIIASMVLTGGPRRIKIADFDTLDPSNLNRIRAGVADIGTSKIELVARSVWDVDPFAKLYLWKDGLAEEDLPKFMEGAPALDVLVDEMDDLALKTAMRYRAKKQRIPVLMATDNGDGVLLDVERFDLEPRRPIFHGWVGHLTVAEARKAKGPEWIALVKKIIGEKYMTKRHRESLKEVGKTLAGVPQLGTDALSAGAVMSIALRRIAAGEPLASGRYVVDFGTVLKRPVSR